MKTRGCVALLCVLLAATLAPGVASAQEVALTYGRLLGDDLLDRAPLIGADAPADFSDAPIYGARLTMSAIAVQLEVAALVAPSKLLEGTVAEAEARFTYLEAAAVVRVLPGPIAPFVAAGVGLHTISFTLDGADSYSKLGYNVGAGLKIGLGGKIGIRADLRDHITPLKVAEMDPLLVDTLGLTEDRTVHDFELSVGLIISF